VPAFTALPPNMPSFLNVISVASLAPVRHTLPNFSNSPKITRPFLEGRPYDTLTSAVLTVSRGLAGFFSYPKQLVITTARLANNKNFFMGFFFDE